MGIRYIEDKKQWIIETKNSGYSFGLISDSFIHFIYYGKRLNADYDYYSADFIPQTASFDSIQNINSEEYTWWGGYRYSETCLKIDFGNGDRGLELEYQDYKITDNMLIIQLKDKKYDLNVELVYSVYEKYDLIDKRVRIINNSGMEIELQNNFSGKLNIPGMEEYRMTYLYGQWAGETRLEKLKLSKGRFEIDSRRGHTSHYYNPFFAIDDGRATETEGQVYFGILSYGGNWKLTVEKSNIDKVSAVMGINNFDNGIRLENGKVFETPSMIIGYTDGGFGEMSRNLHAYQMDNVIIDKGLRPVLYNSWEATYFDVTVHGQMKLAEIAASIGVERFVVDDGWFGERHSDRAGLGDWTVNKKKFPDGIKPLIDYVKSLGMDFGIWLEPEMINKDSDLYRKNPHWVISFEGRERTELRNQMVLNLALKEVREYIKNVFDNLLKENDVKFIKWDMNRAITEPGCGRGNLWIEYTEGLYEILDYLNEKYPDLEIESCSGGGGRIDMEVMKRVVEFWTSDNTDPYDRLQIQHGYSLAYLPKAMMCWVTDSPNWLNKRETSLEYRFHSAMQGSLGIGMNLSKLTQEELDESKVLIEKYKKIRAIIQEGKQYRLLNNYDNGHNALQYVSKTGEESVVFTFAKSKHYGIGFYVVKLAGLEESGIYENLETGDKKSGKALMEIGLRVEFDCDYSSKIFNYRKII